MKRCPRCRGALMLLDLHEPLRCLNCGYIDYPDVDAARELAQPGPRTTGQPRRPGPSRQGMPL